MISRRSLIKSLTAFYPLLLTHKVRANMIPSQQRIDSIIEEYSSQGNHRTATDVDTLSGHWLADHIEKIGLAPKLSRFNIQRLDVDRADINIGGTIIKGLPTFDGASTQPEGLSGSLGALGSGSDIGVIQLSPASIHPHYSEVARARSQSQHRAILLVADTYFPGGGPVPLNAQSFGNPFGPPVLQIGNERWKEVSAAVSNNAMAKMIVTYHQTNTTAFNVEANIAGSQPGLSPIVVMTPRSGWWRCASERGGGIAILLEVMRAVKKGNPARQVKFTANTGHELGHLGFEHFLKQDSGLVKDARLWLHLGANIGASVDPGVLLQFSDQATRNELTKFINTEQLENYSTTPLGKRPLGEARAVFDGGGRYASILGANGLFHHPADIWPGAVNTKAISIYAKALSAMIVSISQQ